MSQVMGESGGFEQRWEADEARARFQVPAMQRLQSFSGQSASEYYPQPPARNHPKNAKRGKFGSQHKKPFLGRPPSFSEHWQQTRGLDQRH